MDSIILFGCLSISPDKLGILKSDLEKLIKVDPSEEVKSAAKEANKSINQRQIFIDGDNEAITYSVDFYHREEKGSKGSDYFGSDKYSSPFNP